MGVLSEVTVGTPPRRRGGQQTDTGTRRRERNTPASAGRTTTRNTPASAGRTPSHRTRSCCPAEHPRVGGEDAVVEKWTGFSFGTPPRRRGGLAGEAGGEGGERNTPASAGRTGRCSPRGPAPAEHPRVGGEDDRRYTGHEKTGGTPPRRRGGQEGPGVFLLGFRNTPASAGRTACRLLTGWWPAEHPRVGGEDPEDVDYRVGRFGTPPRRRGGRVRAALNGERGRNTPASAGRTHCRARTAPSRSEHPRVGGEDGTPTVGLPRSGGTLPRRRGGPPLGLRRPWTGRNTPASAGRTSRGWPRTPWPSEHPRVGGEDRTDGCPPGPARGTPPRRRGGQLDLGVAHVGVRNTPASAGRTRSWARVRCQKAEHPRVGGEDTTWRPSWSLMRGTPPRRRGGLGGGLLFVGLLRNTPASAGRTSTRPSWTTSRSEHPRVGGEDGQARRGGPQGDRRPR